MSFVIVFITLNYRSTNNMDYEYAKEQLVKQDIESARLREEVAQLVKKKDSIHQEIKRKNRILLDKQKLMARYRSIVLQNSAEHKIYNSPSYVWLKSSTTSSSSSASYSVSPSPSASASTSTSMTSYYGNIHITLLKSMCFLKSYKIE